MGVQWVSLRYPGRLQGRCKNSVGRPSVTAARFPAKSGSGHAQGTPAMNTATAHSARTANIPAVAARWSSRRPLGLRQRRLPRQPALQVHRSREHAGDLRRAQRLGRQPRRSGPVRPYRALQPVCHRLGRAGRQHASPHRPQHAFPPALGRGAAVGLAVMTAPFPSICSRRWASIPTTMAAVSLSPRA